jgi:ribosome biogenesis protein ERB1
MRTLQVGAPVKDIAWNPNPSISILAAAVGADLVIINSQLGDCLVITKTDDMIQSFDPSMDDTPEDKRLPIDWNAVKDITERKVGLRLRISHSKTVNQIVWHRQGDYLSVVVEGAGTSSVIIHRLSKRQSQRPFSALKGDVQCVQFHPTAPHFFVATKIAVRKYNLLKQQMTKKLFTNCRWVSSMAIHPQGDHLIIGSYDRKLSWFDLDLSNKPYQTLKNHDKAIRQVCYHKRYPLFASGSADGSIIVYHGRVYDDLMQNPTIVPVKILRCHSSAEGSDIGVLDCEFHPSQPWIFTCGADNTIKLFT